MKKYLKNIGSNQHFQQLFFSVVIVLVWQLTLEMVNKFLMPLFGTKNLNPFHLKNNFFSRWFQWDSGWYYNIVNNGYVYIKTPYPSQQNIVFLPTFPILVL